MDPALLESYRLSSKEYQKIIERLGREPSPIELSLFSALWNEHCSYKSSIKHLRKLYFPSKKVVAGHGENAGVIDLGDGEKIAFKVESHNHPSRITPYQGASTGVGGILRDIFIMGARPIALADYLCFGELSYPITSHLVDGVVRGIGDYGNSIGVPVVTGQTEFHTSYRENTLVQAVALGYFGPKDPVISSKTQEPGLLLYVGAKTGRDGIHGASMASEALGLKDTKTSVQIGDPFYGKLLMESLLEAAKKNLILAAQDMGAAGLTSSSIEIAVKSKMGMKLYLDRVPLRDSTMTPEDILLSESQERALLVVSTKHLQDLKQIFSKWSLDSQVIGELIEDPILSIFWDQKLLTKLSLEKLKAPEYHRFFDSELLNNYKTRNNKTVRFFKHTKESDTLLSALRDERGCTREFIYQQYDQRVGTNTIKDASFPFAVLRLPYSGRALGFCLGGRPHMMRLNPFEGAKDAVYEPAIQLAARGFTPLALTDGLNFGSPENKKTMSDFIACVDALKIASQTLQTPIVSGNVSFYNTTKNKKNSNVETSITGTPVIAFTGIKKSTNIIPASVGDPTYEHFQNSQIYLLSAHQVSSNGLIGEIAGAPASRTGFLQDSICRQLVQLLVQTVKDAPPSLLSVVGPFGLAYTLARMVLKGKQGIHIQTQKDPFQMRLYEIVLVLNAETYPIWENKIKSVSAMQLECLGKWITNPTLCFNHLKWSISELQVAYESSWDHVKTTHN